MAKIVKSAKADIFLRDTDTQSLFNNSGVLSYKYFHEWNDAYNPATDETVQINGESYDEETESYKPNCPTGFSPVFNGRQSALWDNLVSCFPDKIKDMYQKMRTNGLSYRDMLGKYKEFWRYWCENLYNADAFGYANTDNFTKAYGDKLQLMDYFLSKRQRYMDSKFVCGSSVANNLMLRLYEQGKGFAIKYYQAIYSSVAWGSKVEPQRNIKVGSYSYIPFGLEGLQDATINIYDADMITELSTYTKSVSGTYTISGLEGLGNFKFNLNMGLLQRLTKLVMAYTKSKPNTAEIGENFDMSAMRMLRQVIVTNVQNLTKSIVLSSDLIEEIDFTGTPIAGVTTPPTDALTKLTLPESITELHLVGYTNLAESGLKVASYANIKTLDFEDCPLLNGLSIVTACYNAGAPLTDVTIKGISWKLDNLDLLLYLAKKGAKLQGKITISDTVRVSFEQKRTLLNAFGNIDSETNSLYISYTKVAINSVAIKGTRYLDKKGAFTFSVSTSPIGGNDFVSAKWSISDNKFATIEDPNVGVVAVKEVGSKENGDKATITATATLSDGRELEATAEIYFYKYDLQLGDYLYYDGTYSNELDSDRTVVGICFYIDQEGEYALFVALDDYGSRVWGLWDGNSYYGIQNIQCKEYTFDIYDIKTLDNIYNNGAGYITDATMLDSTTWDGFKVYPNNTASGDFGFITITQTLYDNEIGEYLNKIGLGVGDKISAGLLNTLRIIKHRDSILSDSAINLRIPHSAEQLASYIEEVQGKHNTEQNYTKYEQYYYPAASYCHAYTPKIKSNETLMTGIGNGCWHLPSAGEMARLAFYNRHGINTEDKLAIFTKSLQNKYLSPLFNYSFYSRYYWTSTESGSGIIYSYEKADNAVWIPGGDAGRQKCYDNVVRPVLSLKIK